MKHALFLYTHFLSMHLVHLLTSFELLPGRNNSVSCAAKFFTKSRTSSSEQNVFLADPISVDKKIKNRVITAWSTSELYGGWSNSSKPKY